MHETLWTLEAGPTFFERAPYDFINNSYKIRNSKKSYNAKKTTINAKDFYYDADIYSEEKAKQIISDACK